uniref:Uncharacterized protein n=1 Tax=Timema cristinae TaxID=61476 RepID=A0A7R9CQZ1_TIMCR|nr:unnamed protein product [Timema cristinae]
MLVPEYNVVYLWKKGRDNETKQVSQDTWVTPSSEFCHFCYLLLQTLEQTKATNKDTECRVEERKLNVMEERKLRRVCNRPTPTSGWWGWGIALGHTRTRGGLSANRENSRTYFSENALLPGLVKGDFDEDMTAKNYQSELLEESSRYPNSMPYPWLLAKFRQLSLDVYTHNFTLNYPLGYGTKYTGKNVYAILRAPRSASTEALVLSVPYRPPNSAHPGTMPSIALMLSLAKFFRHLAKGASFAMIEHARTCYMFIGLCVVVGQKYWAKDVIFLVTEHEQLGVQAWLEAYHQTTCGRSGVLDHGDMTGRGGAIQAAINLELHAEKIGHVDVKVEGLNGQLPNLDLVNLVHRMCSKEGVKHTFKNRENSNHRDPMKEWSHQLKTLMAMVTTQATGIPNGNHGLFHRSGMKSTLPNCNPVLSLRSTDCRNPDTSEFVHKRHFVIAAVT